MVEKRYGHPNVEKLHERYLAFMAEIHTHYKDFSTRFFPRLPAFIGIAVSNAIRK